MKTKYSFIYAILFLSVILSSSSLYSQPKVAVTLLQPVSKQLSPENLWSLELENKTGNPLDIYLKVSLEEQTKGKIAEGTSPVFKLNPGISDINYRNFESPLSWINYEIKDIIIKKGNIPSGSYKTCVMVFSGGGDLLCTESCIIVEGKNEKENIELVSPQSDNFQLKDQVSFVWTGPPLSANSSYKIKIVELSESQSPQSAILNNPAFYEQEGIKTTFLLYPASAPKLLKGKKYAWVVSSDILSSEVLSFSSSAVQFENNDNLVCTTVWSNLSIRILPNPPTYITCGSTVNNINANQNVRIEGDYNCTANGDTYDWIVIHPNGTTLISASGQSNLLINFTPLVEGTYIAVISPKCNGSCCSPCVIKLEVANNCPCGPGDWDQFTIGQGPDPPVPIHPVCGGSVRNIMLNYPVNLTGGYNSPCNVTYDWLVSGPTGTVVNASGQNNLLIEFTPQVAGTYTAVITPHSGSTECEPCLISFIVSDNCPCNPGGWDPFTVTHGPNLPFHLGCGGSVNNIMLYDPVNLRGAYNSPCNVTYDWIVSGPSGIVVSESDWSILDFTFVPYIPGTYAAIITPHSGSTECEPCVISFIVLDDCKCGLWNQFTVTHSTPLITVNPVCGGIINNIELGSDVTLSGSYNASCDKTYDWVVSGPTGTVVSSSGQSSLSFNFNAAVTGTYTAVITPHSGSNRCDPCIITFVVLDDCLCGTWGTFNLSLDGNTSNPVCGQTINSIPLNTPVSLTGIYNTSAGCAASFDWVVNRPDGTTLTSGGRQSSLSVEFTAAIPGTYTITIIPHSGSLECTSCAFTLVVLDDCLCGTWNQFTVTHSTPLITVNPVCGGTVNNIELGSDVSLTGSYTASCAVSYDWVVSGPTGTVVNASGQSGLSFNFNAVVAGTYTAVITPHSGSNSCDPCIITFVVLDDCLCGTWNQLTVTHSTPLITVNPACGGIVNNIELGSDVTLTGSYSALCTVTYDWVVSGPAGTVVSTSGQSGLSFNFNAAVAGTYTAVITPHSGSNSCDPCIITFVVLDDCLCGTWNQLTVTHSTPLITVNPACGGIVNNIELGSDVTLTGSYSALCTVTYDWVVSGPAGTVVNAGGQSGISFNFNAAVAGTYTAVITPHSGSNQCDPCVITFVVLDDCLCGTWDQLTVTHSKPLITVNPVCGGIVNNIELGSDVTLTGSYSALCTVTYDWVVSGPGGTVVNASGQSGLSFNFNAAVAGTYTAVITPHSGSNRCDPCIITFVVLDDCLCGTWNQFTVTHSTPLITVNPVCGGIVNNIELGSDVTLAGSYTASCAVSYDWVVSGPTGTVVNAGGQSGLSFNFNAVVAGTYTAVITPHSGSNSCDPCIITFVVLDDCLCGIWNQFTVTHSSPLISANPVCGGIVNNIELGSNVNLTGSYSSLCAVTYDWVVSGPGGIISSADAQSILSINMYPSLAGLYTAVITPNSGSNHCDPCFINFEVLDTCLCGTWGEFSVLHSDTGLAHPLCGQSVNNIMLNIPVWLTGNYDIPDNCPVSYSWTVSGPGGFKLGEFQQSTLSIGFTPILSGTYTVVITPFSGNRECPPCVFELNTESTICNCDRWLIRSALVVKAFPDTRFQYNANCDSTIDIGTGDYKIIVPEYICSSTNNCNATFLWTVLKPNGTSINGSGKKFEFNFDRRGIYKITLIPNCGGTPCDSCQFYARVY